VTSDQSKTLAHRQSSARLTLCGMGSLYDKIGRNYDFALDAWTIAEDCGVRSEDYYDECTVSITETTTQGGQQVIHPDTTLYHPTRCS
jgi:hypothetical protein